VEKLVEKNLWKKTCGKKLVEKTALFIRIDSHTTQNTD
jgi:hypothetical protein